MWAKTCVKPQKGSNAGKTVQNSSFFLFVKNSDQDPVLIFFAKFILFFNSQKFIAQNPKRTELNTFVFVPTHDRVLGLDVSGDIIGDITLGSEHESPSSQT